jgi:acyl carrier protein
MTMTIAMSAREDAETRVRRILCELLLLDAGEVRSESLLIEDLDVDSITFLELAFAVEKEFGVDFPDVKASEETFVLLLPDALQKLEATPGGTTFFEFIKREAICNGTAAVAAADDRERRFRALTVGALARSLGGQVPGGLDATLPIETLRLNDLFRFLTVGTLTRYVEFLVTGGPSSGRTWSS